ncbi:GH25 family lysozyme [Bacillus gobiensis]|uniref:GH25 family lysozyme n=1 Tax=Bacillus gobiensis TaxID=1441095 RepID=UPI003D1B4B59
MSVWNATKGIDVSHLRGNIDWKNVEADGLEFAFIKATESIITSMIIFHECSQRMYKRRNIIKSKY